MQRRRTILSKVLLLLGPIGLTLALAALLVARPGALGPLSRLVVADGDSVDLIASVFAQTVDPTPVADAGPDRRVGGASNPGGDDLGFSFVVLDGSGSTDPNGEMLSYSWRFLSVPDGSFAEFDDPTSVRPAFEAEPPDGGGGGEFAESQAVAGPEDYEIELTVTNSSGLSDTDTVIFSFDNVAPLADAGVDRRAEVGESVELDASASSDDDGDLVSYSWTLTEVPAGSLAALDDATALRPRFTIDLEGTYVAELVVNDGQFDSDADRVVVSTEGVAPVARISPHVAIFPRPGDTVQFDASGSSDDDGDELDYDWVLLAVPALSTAQLDDRGAVRPKLTIDQDGFYVLQLTVTDATGRTSRDTLAVAGSVPAGAADAGPDQTVVVGATVALDGSATSSPDFIDLDYRWSLIAKPEGSTAILSDEESLRPEFVADLPGTYVAQLKVADGEFVDGSTPDSVVITTENSPPVAEAGLDQTVTLGALVQLDGGGSTDADGNVLTYSWALLEAPDGLPAGGAAVLGPGPAQATGSDDDDDDDDTDDGGDDDDDGGGPGPGNGLSDPTAVNPTFVVDFEGLYIVQLIVNDGQTQSAADTVVISTVNSRPVAEAGTGRDVLLPDEIQLDASGSFDADSDVLTYFWTLIKLPPFSDARLSDEFAADPTFTPDLAGEYVAQLVVGDGQLVSRPDTVVFRLGNTRPVADAGRNLIVRPGATATLDGSGSQDFDGDPLTYAWTFFSKPAGSAAVLSGADTVSPSFTTDVSGPYEVQLVVNDGTIDSFPDTVVVNANTRPIANAGPNQDGFLTETVQLDGTASSDPDGDPLTFSWTLFGPLGANSQATLSDRTSPTPTFVPDVLGTYRTFLTVSDGVESSSSSRRSVTVENRSPVAEAGPAQTVSAAGTVQLDGSGSSDPDGQSLTYAWQLETPLGSSATLVNRTTVNPTFVPDLAGVYVATLTVADGFGGSASDDVLLTAERLGPGNVPPVLEPVGDQTVAVGETLRLTLSASDANLEPFTFSAAPIPLPEGMSLDSTTGELVFAPSPGQEGSFTLTLSVSDGAASDSESVLFTVLDGATGGATALTGLVLDANDFAGGVTTPLVGATVSLLGTDLTAATDAGGRFILSDVPSGKQVLSVVGATAAPAPDGSAYGSLFDEIELLEGVTNTIDRGVFLTRVDSDSTVVVNPAATTVVSNGAARLTVKANVAFSSDNTPYTGTLSLSRVPAELAVSLLPAGISPCNLLSIEPFGVRFVNTGFFRQAELNLPNVDNLPRNTEVEVWALNPATGTFSIVTTGEVGNFSFTSHLIEVNQIPFSGLYFAVPRGVSANVTSDSNSDNVTPTALADGNLTESITLPSYRSLGQDRARTFVYNSTAASPVPIVAADVTLPLLGPRRKSPQPELLEARLEVGGLAVGPVFTSLTEPDDPDDPGLEPGQTVRQAIAFDGGGLPSGLHPYRLESTANYGCSRRSTVTQGQVVIKNEADSPFGAGWTLAELQRVTKQDGRLLLEEGNGSTLTFAPAFTGEHFLEPTFFSANAALTMAVDDLNNDGALDVAVPDHVPGIVKILLGDGAGNLNLLREIDTGAPTEVGTPPDTTAVATGDFDGNGIRDLAVVNQIAQQVKVFKGTGGAAYQEVAVLGISVKRPVDLGVADFNGDGNDDIATISNPRVIGDINGRLTVFLGDGAGTFPTTREFGAANGSAALAVGDFNNDQVPDIATVSYGASKVSVFSNDGTGIFTRRDFAAGPLRALVGRRAIAAGDLDGDGFADLAVTNSGSTLSVLINDGTGGFPNRKALPNGRPRESFEPKSVEIVDINGDGPLDLVASGQDAGNVSIHLGDGLGGFGAPSVIPVGSPTMNALRVADFDANGLPDILVGSDTDQVVYLLLGDPASPTTYQSPPADFSTLVENQDGTFTRTLKDGTRFEFDSAGKMTAEIDRNGNTTRYLYNADGTLAKVIDPTNSVADPACGAPGVTCLTYVNGLLSAVSDPGDRVTSQAYDADGNLIRITNPDGSTREFAYDENNRLITSTSERDFDTTHNYGAAGQWLGSGFPDGASIAADISKNLGLADLGIGLGGPTTPAPYARPNGTAMLEDAKGNPYKMRFNRFGSPIEITDPIGRTTVLERDADDLVTAVVRPNDGELPDGSVPATVRTEIDYDARGNVTAQREAVGTVLERANRFVYEPVFNNVTLIADPANTDANPQCGTAGVTCFVYDAQGNLEQVTAFVDGGEIFPQTSTYDSRGLELTREDAEKNVTEFVYTPLGDLDKIIDAELNETKFERDNLGRVTARIEGLDTPEERTIGFTYDAMNRVETETDGAGGITTTRYDAAGNIIETEDATGIVVTREYDERNRLTLEDDPVQGPVTRSYDANGNLETVANGLSDSVSLFYDSVNRLTKAIDPLLNERLFDYDALNNRTTVTDGRQNTTTFVYDPLGRQIRRVNALDQTWRFAFDSRDNVTRTDDAKGQAIVRTYDALSRLRTTTLIESDGATVEDEIALTYDANSNRLTAKDGDSSLAFTYDGLNRIASAQTLADPGTVQPAVILTSGYDAVGNRTSLTHGPNELLVEGTWNFGHDGVGRLTDLVDPIGDPNNPVTLSYDAAGRLARTAFPNQVVSDFAYDLLTGRPATIRHSRGPIEIDRLDYGYDAEGQVTSLTEPAGTRNFTYDAFQQLTGGGFASAPESYSYDAEGNRIVSHLSAGHSHDAANRLTEDDAFCYAYDANGNLASKTAKAAGACTGPVTTYEWDVQNRLVRIDFPNSTSAAYRYDADGRRIEKDGAGAVARYLYDGDAILLEFDNANTLQARYSHGLEIDQPLVMERGGQTYAYHMDLLGSIRRLTNATGAVANSYATEAFGRFEQRSETVANPFAFTAREFDLESGLHFYRARYYDPLAGRFLSEDPTGFEGGDGNLYRYVYNSPTSLLDPSGRFVKAWSDSLRVSERALFVALINTLLYTGNEIIQDDSCDRSKRFAAFALAAFGTVATAAVLGSKDSTVAALAIGFFGSTILNFALLQAVEAIEKPTERLRRADSRVDPCA